MMAPTGTPDPTMDAITSAVGLAGSGDQESARRELLGLWQDIGVLGDALHRCTLAHFLADLYDDPAEGLVWDLRALDAAEALTDVRTRQHHAVLDVAGFYASLYLNLADNFRRLGAFRVAAENISHAEQHLIALPEGAYGDQVRKAVREVGQAIATQDTARRPSAPRSAD